MWKKTVDLTIRAVVLISVAAFDHAPVMALEMPAMTPGAPKDGVVTPDFAPLILAQSVDHPPSRASSPTTYGHDRPREISVNTITTSKVVLDLASVRRECSNYDEVYRIDCLRQGIAMIASSLPDNSEYRDVKRILNQASSRLGKIVATYQDPATPKLEVPANANPRFRKRRSYTAIRREAVATAMAQAQNVITEATTQLLRSAENSERRYAHYQQISVAVDSTKVLLRSS